MIRFSISAAIRQITGISLLVTLLYRQFTVGIENQTVAYAIFVVACAMIAPEIVRELIEAWKAHKS